MKEERLNCRMDMVILDVGHGNAAIVHEGGTTVLIDTALRSHVLEYLQQQQISTLDLVVLSHADQDHIGGLVGILASGIRVKKIKLNADSQKETQEWRDLIFEIDQRDRNGELIFEVGMTSGPLIVEGLNKYGLEVLMPTTALAALGVGARDRFGNLITSNSISGCMRVSFETRAVALFAGDMDAVSLAEAIHTSRDLIAPVLVFPHHGGLPGNIDPTAFATTLINLVKPRCVVFSIGRNKHENPRPEILEAIRNVDSTIKIACTQLSKTCSKVVSEDESHLSGIFSAGSASKACCAGSMVIDPVPAEITRPTRELHTKFINNFPSAMCRST